MVVAWAAWAAKVLPLRVRFIKPGPAIAALIIGGLAALTTAVPRDEFDVEPLRESLNDLRWLGRVAREHEAVLEQMLARATVVPLRLCTIFEDAAGVQGMLEREHDALTDALGRLEGRQEWGVKVLLESDRLAPAAEEPQAQDGLAYLARRREQLAAREEARGTTAQLVDQVDGALRAIAVDAVRLPAQNRELSGHSGDMVLNAAYLVCDPAELRDCVETLQARHAAQGVRIDLTGPWPPYNFVTSATAAQPA